jgi:hypothetical protein
MRTGVLFLVGGRPKGVQLGDGNTIIPWPPTQPHELAGTAPGSSAARGAGAGPAIMKRAVASRVRISSASVGRPLAATGHPGQTRV